MTLELCLSPLRGNMAWHLAALHTPSTLYLSYMLETSPHKCDDITSYNYINHDILPCTAC